MTNNLVETLRERAQAQEWTASRIVAEIDSIKRLDWRFIAHCQNIKAELVPLLQVLSSGTATNGLLNASLLLLYLDQPEGTQGIVTCLRDGDVELRRATLFGLMPLPKRKVDIAFPMWSQFAVPLDSKLIFDVLKPLLQEPEIYPNYHAIAVAGLINIPEIQPIMQGYLHHLSRDIQTLALDWHARRNKDDGALELAADMLFGQEVKPHDNYSIVSSMEIYCEGKSRVLSLRAAKILADFVAANVDYPGNSMANDISNALQGIENAQYPDELRIVKAVLNSNVDDWRCGNALERLSEIEGSSSTELLRSSLADDALRKYAAKGIAKVARNSDNELLIASLFESLLAEKRNSVSRSLVRALITVGNRGVKRLEKILTSLEPYDAMQVYWLSNDISPSRATKRLMELGIVTQIEDSTLLEIEDDWTNNHQPRSVVIELLEADKLVMALDRKTLDDPPDYMRVLHDLRDISQSIFSIEAVIQTYDENTDKIKLEFVLQDESFTIHTQNFGRWYDVESLLYGLNSVLSTIGKEERFIMLFTDDQTCVIVFVPEAAFLKVSQELLIPWAEDLQAWLPQSNS